jgi:hypothetical protein
MRTVGDEPGSAEYSRREPCTVFGLKQAGKADSVPLGNEQGGVLPDGRAYKYVLDSQTPLDSILPYWGGGWSQNSCRAQQRLVGGEVSEAEH